MMPLFINSDYGIWGYLISYFPALLVLVGLFLVVLILDFFIKNNLKMQRFSYGILGIILSVIVLSSFYQGTFNETVYLSFPPGIVGVWVVCKFSRSSKKRLLSFVWLGFILALICVGISKVYF